MVPHVRGNISPSLSGKIIENVSIDLWAANLEPVMPDLATWLTGLDAKAAFAPVDLPIESTLGWLFECGQVALDAIATISVRHEVSVLAGTIPFAPGLVDGLPTYLNRAWLLTPDGMRHHQDKLSLTPLETYGAGGVTVPGKTINVFDWNGLRMAMIICLDSEFTDLWSKLGTLNLDLIIIPAKTDMITGYNRVFSCARARAIELQAVVCVLDAAGVPFGQPLTDTGVGGASVFTPCDVGVSLAGIHAALAPQSAAMMTDHVLMAADIPVDIPVGACRGLRNGHAEAEVCPALWDASHLVVNDFRYPK